MRPAWSHFPHSADLGVRGTGTTLAEAFEQCAVALFAAMADLDAVRTTVEVELHCEAPDPKLLLTDWLNALIYRVAVDRLVFRRFEVSIADGRLIGRAWGEPLDWERHHLGVEPKGATLTELRVERQADGSWLAQCVVDV